MDVTAYNTGAGTKSELGKLADQIWVGGFRFSETRTIQVSRPMNAAAPNLFDRAGRMEDFSFAAGRSFGPGGTAVADALQFLGSHSATVPALADLQFIAQGGEIWLNGCGISRLELVQKTGALVVFGYTIIGGTWGKQRTQ